MSQLESAVIGWLSGFVIGSFLVFVIIGFLLLRSEKIDRPEELQSVIDTVRKDYYNPEQQIFLTAFAIGFIMGVGGSKEVAERS